MTGLGLGDLRQAGHAELAAKLEAVVDAVAVEAAHNPRFADALAAVLGHDGPTPGPTTPGPTTTVGSESDDVGRLGASTGRARRSGRRAPGSFDPFEVYADGEHELRRRLEACNVEELKDIISEHGMDHDRLALKWKTSERLIERIVDTVASRSRKGDVFRAPQSRRDGSTGSA